ncbi:hypothetical protein EDD21DRAFT_371311 [Dissophora ornata]|nr:hypothetical protein BGZ58_001217 [Dissophora ornata]KAI8602627.1 hypothetical protein EDD21DRAFT_371311 [Dissophora ornata]
MAEIDQADLDEIKSILQATEKAELELAQKRVEKLTPIWEKRREVITKIPDFWATVCQTHHDFSQMIEDHDVPIIEHLTDIWVKHDPKDVRNCEIIFTFKENPYFTNKELIMKVVNTDEESVVEDFDIDWKEGKDVTRKDQKRKKDDDDNTVESFFSWFRESDSTLAHIFVQDVFPEALTLYTQGDNDVFEEEEGSVDLSDEDEDEDEEEEKHIKKKSKK